MDKITRQNLIKTERSQTYTEHSTKEQQNVHFSSALGIIPNIYHMLSYKTRLKKFSKISIIQSVFSDRDRVN